MKHTRLEPIDVALSGSHLIEASAGTGKTYAIATLYVRLLLEEELDASQILVVTYTNAATAELRLRIRRRLRDTLDALTTRAWPGDEVLDRFIRRRCEAGTGDSDRVRLLAALHAFDEAAIFTIHGFCQRVLQENAVESGVPFDTELLTNITGLVDDIVKDFWVARLHDAPASFVRCLQDTKLKIDDLQRIAFNVITHPGIEVLPALDDSTVDLPAAMQALLLQRDFAEFARNELRSRKEAAHVQSFDDLLQRLGEALAAPGGDELATLVRTRYRAAMIDEFQDTDPVQYDIFHRIYGGTSAPLFLIGDPKQAIYGFRGADVFTYMDAKREAAATHTLLVNRRSDPALLRAINTIFERAQPAFLFDEIGYDRIEAPPEARDRLGGSRRGRPPFEILFLPRRHFKLKNPQITMITKEQAAPFITAAIASQVVAFLSEGATLIEDETERPVLPSDIAVLCRKNNEAHAVQEALRVRGVHAVLQTDATVFETAEAVAVERTLRALANPADNRALRAALASSLIGIDAISLQAFENDEQQWDDWARRFRDWHDRWITRGFVTAFRGLLDELDIEKRILGRVGGERQLTDVLHLVELLHRASIEQRLGPEALLQWLAQMRNDAAARNQLLGEAARVRLESDEAAVKLVTIHRSKGLEYPIVFCPFSWDGRLLQGHEKKAARFHDPQDDHRLKLDLGSDQLEAHVKLAERESLAENLRLLYVAFTRARHYCGVVWGAINEGEGSALAYLLHQDHEAPVPDRAARTKERAKELPEAAMAKDLHALVAASGDAIAVVELEPASESLAILPAATAASLTPPESHRHLYASWRTSSFSGLIAAPSATLSSPDEEGIDHDATAAATATGEGEPVTHETVPAVDLPFSALAGGARAGELVHRLLEKLDFEFDTTAQLRERLEPWVPRSGPVQTAFPALVEDLAGVLETPLGGSAASLKLRQVAMHRRLNELEFLLPVGGGRERRLTVDRLAAVFARHAGTPSQSQYAQRLAHLGFTTLEGYVKGFIDLVFEHDGKWYVVDYKTNYLGPAVADYVTTALEGAMALHHYTLQGHLYAVALHRHLTSRLRGYDYDRHFGGIYYLFLRGMSPRFPPGSGIWHELPRRERIEDLSALFAPAEMSQRGGT